MQSRPFHTSNALHARASFARRLKDTIQKIRQDPNAQQKIVGVGAAGYSVAKVAKIGAVAKYALPALKLTKAMPLMSMGLTTVCYSCFFGLPFAVGIVSTMASSNMARAAFLKRFGCEVQPTMMIPFFGTMSGGSTSDYRKSEEHVLAGKPFEKCLVTLAPVIGMTLFTATGPLGVAGLMMESQCGFAVANTGFMMGMFSLVPMGEMTPGGQLLNYFSKNALLFGTALNAGLMIVLSNPILYLCFFLNLYRLYQRGFSIFGRQFGGSDDAAYHEVARGLTVSNFTDSQKITIALLYWSLFLLNAGGMMFVGKSLRSPRQLQEERRRAEEMEWRLNTDPQNQRFSSPPASHNDGWGVGSWAMNSLEAVEEMDRDDDKPLDWWEQAQLDAVRNVPQNERFRER